MNQPEKIEMFSEDKFALQHLGHNRWIIKSAEGETWWGKQGWIPEKSALACVDPDVEASIFEWNDLVQFVQNVFGCYLPKIE